MSLLSLAMYRRYLTVLWKSASTFTSTRLRPVITSWPQKLSTSAKVDRPTDPTPLPKFRCHPTIACDIPVTNEDLDALWYHIPDDLLPINWSSDWLKFFPFWFLPYDTYSMGPVDVLLKVYYGIPYPIKGVMYCTVERIEPGGLFTQKQLRHWPECIVFQDALGEYYFYYEFMQGGDEYLAKFRAPRGTMVSDFVKHHFQGGVMGVDMDLVLPLDKPASSSEIWDREWALCKLRKEAQEQSRCACRHASREAKLKNLRPVE